MAVPSAVALMTIGNPVVSVLFQRGAFSALDASMTAKALFWSCPGIIALAILRITVPVFYSMKNTLIPMAVPLPPSWSMARWAGF